MLSRRGVACLGRRGSGGAVGQLRDEAAVEQVEGGEEGVWVEGVEG